MRFRGLAVPFALLAYVLVLPLACGGDDGTGPADENGDGGEVVPDAIETVSSAPGSAVVGTTLPDPLAVRVVDDQGSGVSGVSVSWSVPAGGGSVSATSTTTNASGEASVEWTLGTTAGTNTLRASLPAHGSLAPAEFETLGEPDAPATVAISPNPVSFAALGDTAAVSATSVQDRYGNEIFDATLVWASADTAVATVEADGDGYGAQVFSVALGEAEIMATADTATGATTAQVSPTVASVEVSPAVDTLVALEDTAQFTATVYDTKSNVIEGASVDWSSAATSVATVDTAGRAVAKGDGSATITASSSGGLSDDATVVVEREVAYATIDPTEAAIGEGQTVQFTAEFLDANGYGMPDAPVTWTTSDPTVAEVDSDGLVTATGWSAVAIITATSGDLSVMVPVEVLGRIAFERVISGDIDIYTMHADGTGQAHLTTSVPDSRQPAWSPDGTQIAFVSPADGDDEVWVVNADGTGALQLTSNAATDDQPVWSPDGTKIAFSSDRDPGDGTTDPEIWVMDADSSNKVQLTDTTSSDRDPAWSPDGTQIAFRSDRDGDGEIYVMNADGSGVTRLTTDGATDRAPDWSPDGAHIAFHSDRTGSGDIYIMNADGTGVVRITTTDDPEGAPVWRPRP